jgi:hypothetical protein
MEFVDESPWRILLSFFDDIRVIFNRELDHLEVFKFFKNINFILLLAMANSDVSNLNLIIIYLLILGTLCRLLC